MKVLTALFVFLLVLGLADVHAQQQQLERAFPALSFNDPVDLQNAGDGSNRIFVVEQRGVIKVFENDSAVGNSTTFLDIEQRVLDGGEQGLLGLTFHPDYENNGHFFVNYTASGPRRTVIARFKVSDADSNVALADSELVIIEYNQPFSNHNAGQIAFGPDGYLYIAVGDGGSGGDPQNHGQRRETLLGNMLRIDVNNSSPSNRYDIPATNPFVLEPSALDEIWAYGLRNPWRFSFDPVTGWLWVADVGQLLWEEINIVQRGGNYGWRIMEGLHCYNPPSGCNMSGLELPIWEYPHTNGNFSVTGGHVYRGPTMPSLEGFYIYADYGSGRIWALDFTDPANPINTEVENATFRITSFGVDESNELFICSTNGRLYRFTPEVAVDIGDNPLPTVQDFKLKANYPNPFNPLTIIPFELKKPALATVSIFNINGEMVTQLIDRQLPAGNHSIAWNGINSNGDAVSSGIYFYRLIVDGQFSQTRRMVLMK